MAKFQEYSNAIRISGPESALGRNLALDFLDKRLAEERNRLARWLAGDETAYPRPEPVSRWRRLLGRKLFDLALRLDPDLGDY